ncbi:MAG: hypothetical protein FWB96_11515 [Defluviitaleaceae bacterium]|nr:hypothetical protein [Defluviitaleaceae bacterium]MCL2263710.1 hypothetical protein [Defluviitaleaceae bacterium]
MDNIYLRVISFADDADCCRRIKARFVAKFSDIPIKEIQFHDWKPYWKIDGFGELGITFSVDYEKYKDDIKTALSSCWRGDVTDSRWARMFCGDISFIWLTDAFS